MKGSRATLLKEICEDLPDGKFTLRNFFFQYFYKPNFRVLFNYRIGTYCSKRRFFLLRHIARVYKYNMVVKRNCDISYRSSIGKRLVLPHPIGVVIGDGVIVKDDVTIFQQVTLGSHGKKGQGLSYPVIESNVKIYAGAKIIGGVVIGENSIVGANTLVNKDVPPNCVAYGIPCKIKKLDK